MTSPVSEPLRVIIVGAGIGGLAAALALRREGHIVQIFEQSHFSAEVGAAVGMFPNATRVLGKLGCELERMAVVPNQGMKMYSAADGKLVMDVDTSKSDERFGSPSVLVHRVDLHNELRRLATEGEGGATLTLGARVTHLDTDAGRITLENGQTHTGDVVIAADGIHSVVRSAITGAPSAPVFSGKSAFRFTVPREKLASNTATKFLLEGRTVVHVVNGGQHIMLLYPCRAGTLLNCICFHPDPAGAVRDGWSTAAKVEDIFPHFKHFAPMFIGVIKLATDVKLYPQSDSSPHSTWIRGRSALLGDAAHAMLPYQAQGATQALEDALALSVILKGASPADVPFRLRIYENVRKSRAEAMQYLSRAQAAGIEQGVTSVSPLELMSFTAGHDVQKYAEQAMTAFWPIPEAET